MKFSVVGWRTIEQTYERIVDAENQVEAIEIVRSWMDGDNYPTREKLMSSEITASPCK